MNLTECIRQSPYILMEGALGERLKREYGLSFDKDVAMAKLVRSKEGRTALTALWGGYAAIAGRYGLPFLATAPTRRANRERMARAGCGAELIAENVAFLRGIQENSGAEMLVGGLMGCKGDAYTGADALDEAEAAAFHSWQAEAFRDAGADFLYAGIMPTLPEAAGMARAMSETGLPYIISFTIQANGRLIDGTSICDAIEYIDRAAPVKPVCYMTNCVHPAIVYAALSKPFNRAVPVQERFLGIQANTSPLSYAELDNAADLKTSAPEPFAADMLALLKISRMKIFGGCCGTDDRHMEEVARRLAAVKGETTK